MSNRIAAAATPMGTLKRRALSLGSANVMDYGLQFLLPVVLTRFLSADEFGEYRLLWLVIMTAMLIVPMQMPTVLNFFLPRSDAETKRLHVHQTLAYLACAGAIGALAMSSLNPLLPDAFRPLQKYGPMVPLLVVLYSVTLLLDTLPTVEERIGWQARATMSLSLLRALALSYAAYATSDIRVLFAVLAGLMALKLAVLLTYVARYHGLGGPWFEWGRFRAQFTHAAPLGAASAFFGMRTQADQWVAATLFSLESFAAFSIASVLLPIVNLARQSINHVFLPSMSRLHAATDLRGMAGLNSRANTMVALIVYPFLALGVIFAEELIALVYTESYVVAAPALRIYSLGLAIIIVEISSLMLLQRDGVFVLRQNIVLALGSAALSWIAASHFGLAGAAVGSMTALYADRFFTLRRIARTTGIPVGELQDWRALGGLLLCSAFAGTTAWAVVDTQAATSGNAIRLMLGGTVIFATYGLLVAMLRDVRRRGAVAAEGGNS